MAEATVAEVKEAVGELRHDLEKKGEIEEEKFQKINDTLDKWDEQKQAIFLEQKAAEKLSKEMEERMVVMEAELAKGVGQLTNNDNHKETEEYKALDTYWKTGSIGSEQKAQLRTTDDTSAGYLVPDAVDTQMVKKITELDPMRSLAQVQTIGSKSIEIVIEDSIPTAYFEAELEQGQYSEPAYTNVTITPFRQTFTARVSEDQLMNSGWDMESQLGQSAAIAFAYGEGAGHVTGTGVKEPEGFTINAAVVAAATDTATNDTFAAVDVLSLWGALKVGYNGTFMMNRLTMAAIRKFVSTGGVFLWQPGLNGPTMNTLCGEPYVLSPSMSSGVTTDGAIVLAYGDWSIGYRITDRTGMAIIRDNITQAREANVLITYRRWTTGRVVLPEAIKIMTIQ